VHVVVRRPRLRGRNASVRAAGNTGKKSGDVHGTTVDWLNEMLVPLVKRKTIVRVQGMIRLSQLSEPEPDIVLLKPRAGRYIDGPPAGADTFPAGAAPRPVGDALLVRCAL
jgi:hypothetical protein